MDINGKYCVSYFFTVDNIEVYTEQVDLDSLIYKLLENLALNYGIGNIKNLFAQNYKKSGRGNKCINLGNNCFLFHFRISSTDNPRIAIAITQKGIFNSNTEFPESVRMIFILTSPKEMPDIYLKIHKSLKDFLTNLNVNAIITQKNSNEIWDFINQNAAELPDIIYANDIMDEVKVSLLENNNLKDAIDLIVKTGYLNIPVVDLEGNLIGEVTSHELMEVCLPGYIIWMNDMTPIVNFEPFQNMIIHEDKTWLAEIMNYNCLTIQQYEPFIKAAIAMTKTSTSQVYVLDDKKLVGTISLRFFIDKIFRE